MSLIHVYDASIPPTTAPHGFKGAAGYLGGRTPHVWTLDEWLVATDDGNLRALGIWTGTREAYPVEHANLAASAAIRLGWKAHANPRRYIAVDEEDTLASAWIEAFARQLKIRGFDCLSYRSLSAILANPTPENADNWTALWNSEPTMHDTPREKGHQYVSGISCLNTTIDRSVFTEEAYAKFGHGKRRRVNAV